MPIALPRSVLASRWRISVRRSTARDTAFDDLTEVASEAERGHRGFSPSESGVDWAKRVVAVAAQSAGAAVALDGKMVDKPVILRAEAVLRARRA